MGHQLEADFDTRRATSAAGHYALSTGILCKVIDAAGTIVTAQPDNDSTSGHDAESDHPCDLCTRFSRITGESIPCRQAHLYGSFQSLRFGGRYTYFCPLGLTHICTPIISDGQMVASLVAGPLLLIDPQEYISAELQDRHGLTEKEAAKLTPSVNRIPQVTTDRAHALGEQLLYTASWASGVNVKELVEEEQRISRESHVSDYIHHLKTMGGGSGDTTYPTDTEQQLLSMIRQGDRDEAGELLAQLVARIRIVTGEQFEPMKARILELVVLLSRAAIDGGADAESVFGMNYRALADIHTFVTVEELCNWISKVATRFVQFVFDVQQAGHRDVIMKALQYMRRNLNKKIGLDEVAGEIRLSPAYFSRIFKENTGSSFTHYLNDLRIERAKTLLRTTELQIIDIALDTGFSDQSHFSRVFRKHTNLSPARYRQSPNTIPLDTKEIHE